MKKKAPSKRTRNTRRSFSFRSLTIFSLTVLAAVAVAYFHQGSFFAVSAQKTPPPPRSDVKISPQAALQMKSLMNEKKSRTNAQQKIETELLYEIKMQQGQSIAPGVQTLRTDVDVDARGYVEVDIRANVSDQLIAALRRAGAQILTVMPQYRTIGARMLIASIEKIAARPDIIAIQSKKEAMLNSKPSPSEPLFSANWMSGLRADMTVSDRPISASEKQSRVREFVRSRVAALTGSQTAQSDTTHRANLARSLTGFDGTGVSIGVLSDGVNGLAARQASGDLPPIVTVLPGQAGPAGGAEGTAMLEIIHDVAPGASLFFATGTTGNTIMAQNIRDLRTAGCTIIIDDITYFNETPFQDGQGPLVVSPGNAGVIVQAVTDVTVGSQAGALYFSSAGNSGNKSDNQSGVWEGDFVAGTYPPGSPLDPGIDGIPHDFGGTVLNRQFATGGRPILKWSDPLGASANDYDLFALSPDGTTVVDAALGVQNGNDDPIEDMGTGVAGDLLVVVQFSGADRFLQLNTNRGRLDVSTNGVVYGHNSSRNSISVAAVPAGPFFAHPLSLGVFGFAHSTANVIEQFSSDGPRRIFFNADGTEITPGNVSSNGGEVLQKPDITAADGVTTTTPGFIPFFGTSAAAPQAGAMMALLMDASPASTNAQLVTAMKGSALDIEAPGTDRDTGAGIFMPLRAMNALGGISAAASVDMGGPVTATEITGNGNGFVEPFENGGLPIRLDNLGLADATNVNATLSTVTPGVVVLPSASRSYGTLAAGTGSATATPPFQFRLLETFPCGGVAQFSLNVTYTGGASPLVFNFSVPTGKVQHFITTTLDTNAPAAAQGFTASTGTQTGRLFRDSPASSCAVPQPAPGLSGAETLQYDAYVFTPGNTGCVTAFLAAVNTDLYYAAYNSSGFVPGNPNTNFLADPGSSVAGTNGFSFNVTAGQPYTIVVHDVALTGAGEGVGFGDPYTLFVNNSALPCLLPTAGEVSIEGRVLTQAGRGIGNTTVTLNSPSGLRRTAVTNTFGFYKLTDVPAGDSYVLVPISKRYQFTPIVLNVTEDLTGVNFIAENP